MKTKELNTATRHLQAIQELQDMSDARMAEILKISNSAYGRVKRGEQRLGLSACRRAYLMGVDPGMLLEPTREDVQHIRGCGLLYRKEYE